MFDQFSDHENNTILTHLNEKGEVVENVNRPLILLSNTSFSRDDKFDYLVRFCRVYEEDE